MVTGGEVDDFVQAPERRCSLLFTGIVKGPEGSLERAGGPWSRLGQDPAAEQGPC